MGDFNKRGIASIIVITAIVGACVIIGIISDKYLGPDNPVEQEAEHIIKEETGVDVDLSPEKKD